MSVQTSGFIGGLIGVLVISALTFSSIGYGEETKREYYPNGKLRVEYVFKNNGHDVTITQYDENGNLKNGNFKSFYQNGQLLAEENFKEGKLDGLAKHYYYKNEKLLDEITYKNGAMVGPFKRYYENGQLKQEGVWNVKQPVAGTVKDYDENGNLKA